MGNFPPPQPQNEPPKSSPRLGLIQTLKSMSLKSTEELSVMTQNYTKFEDELTGHFKVVMRNLTNFDPST